MHRQRTLAGNISVFPLPFFLCVHLLELICIECREPLRFQLIREAVLQELRRTSGDQKPVRFSLYSVMAQHPA